MSNTFNTAIVFLINTLCDFFILLLIIRIILVWVRSDYFHPFTQFIVKLTNFIIKPLRRMLPNVKNIETSSLALIFLVEGIKFFLICLVSFGIPHVLGIFILSLADIIKIFVNIFFYGILIQALLSWIQPNAPILYILHRITSPIMYPLQRLIPPVAGFDISPIPALIILQLLTILLINPLTSIGLQTSFG